MKIGLVSDTHGYNDPRLRDLLRSVNSIIHAGDVGSQEVLDELALIAPVEAVRGNVDSPELGLPVRRVLEWEGVRLEILHMLPASQVELERWSSHAPRSSTETRRRDRFVRGFHAAARVVIFGHTHQPCLAILDGRLFVNPGSAGRKRFSLPRCCAVMSLAAAGVEVKILSLEDYNQTVSKSVNLSFGESAPCLL
jgi:uncharacterized protein